MSFGRYMNNCKNAVRIERMRQRREAGSVADRFPEVAGIVISMTYNQKGIRSILRTFNFFPSSYAFFRANCLSKNCVDGGFDLSQVITTMARSHREMAKGVLGCEGNDPSDTHSDIVYEVAIQYTQADTESHGISDVEGLPEETTGLNHSELGNIRNQ